MHTAPSPAAPDPVPEQNDRTQVTDATRADQSRAGAPTSFEDYVERLVVLGTEVQRLASTGHRDQAETIDREAQALFDQMMRAVPDADAAALAALSECRPPEADGCTPAHLRFRVLDLALRVGLQRRHERTDERDRRALDDLVAAILTMLPSSERAAHDLGRHLLADQPYLGAPHEHAVLDLVAMSGEGRFSPEVATALLSTLWHNLEARGQRSSDQLAGLALLLLDTGNTSERLAAGRLLLDDDRYRLVVLEHLRATRDARLAKELAMAAAQQLPPTAAFAVISAAAQVADDQTAPLLTLGHRDPALLREEYERRLGDDVQPRLRALLVAGAGFTGTEEGIEVARLAFDADPDLEVRMRALFALTGRAAATLGEQAVARALDDPRIRDDPFRLSGVVLALENLARAGMVNAVDRLGQRLRACAMLSESSRQALDQLLASTLPGGGTPR